MPGSKVKSISTGLNEYSWSSWKFVTSALWLLGNACTHWMRLTVKWSGTNDDDRFKNAGQTNIALGTDCNIGSLHMLKEYGLLPPEKDINRARLLGHSSPVALKAADSSAANSGRCCRPNVLKPWQDLIPNRWRISTHAGRSISCRVVYRPTINVGIRSNNETLTRRGVGPGPNNTRKPCEWCKTDRSIETNEVKKCHERILRRFAYPRGELVIWLLRTKVPSSIIRQKDTRGIDPERDGERDVKVKSVPKTTNDDDEDECCTGSSSSSNLLSSATDWPRVHAVLKRTF